MHYSDRRVQFWSLAKSKFHAVWEMILLPVLLR